MEVPGRGKFRVTRGRPGNPTDYRSLSTATRTAVFQRQSEFVWCAVTTLIAFNVPSYDKTNKELTMTRRWNQFTRRWRHFLRCCSHGREGRCCCWCRSQITLVFASYRARSTLQKLLFNLSKRKFHNLIDNVPNPHFAWISLSVVSSLHGS